MNKKNQENGECALPGDDEPPDPLSLKKVLLVADMNYTDQVYAGLKRLKKMGCRFWLASSGADPFVPPKNVFEAHFLTDVCDTMGAFEFIRAQGVRFDAVLTQSCDLITPLVSLLNEEYGCLGITPKTAFICRSKYHMRHALGQASLPIPEFRLCHNAEQLLAAIADIGAPCVVKPVGGHSSFGTFLVRDISDKDFILGQYQAALDYLIAQSQLPLRQMSAMEAEELRALGVDDSIDMLTDFMVEEYMVGNQVCVDSLTQNGETTIMCIASQTRMSPPYFVQVGGSNPFICTPDLERQIHDVVKRSIEAVGIDNSPSHTEIMLTADGPKVVEIACRMGGDDTHDAVLQITGYHLMFESIMIALGQSRRYDIRPRCHMALSYLLPEREGVIRDIQIPKDIRSRAHVTEVGLLAKKGDRVSPPPVGFDYMAYCSAKGRTPQEAARHLERGLKKINIIY